MMNLDSCVPIKDQKERQNPLFEVISVEKQLWALIHSKGLLQTEIQDFYRKARSGYENIILNDHDVELELHDVEYSLWKLHYKHINEFRKRIRQTSANTNQSSIDCHMERFKSFLSEAIEFYHDLITKLRRRHELPEDPFACDKGDGLCAVEPMKLHKCQYSCHRFLVCLGDLARHGELCKKLDLEKHNWSIAATYYFKATSVWPDGGNPQNQLALLATYVGDDFIALYHCIRSLAVKEPFPDAWDNLILLFKKNRSSHLHSLSKEAQFNFSNPCQRSTSLIESQSSSGNNNALEAPDRISSEKCDLWPLFVRMISFFFIESSFEEFPCMFASTMRELDSLLALDDTELKPALDSYQHMDSARTGPYRALQMVSVLIFIVNSLTKSLDQKESKEKNYVQQPILIQSALTATFICVGRLVERCLKSNNPTELSPLLPAVLVFVEWFIGMLEELKTYGAYEKVRSAISYFFDAFVDLLNRLDKSDGEFKYEDHTALWEDYELRGFSPVSQGHGSLDFTSDPKIMGNFDCINACRPKRIFCAAKKIVGRSDGSQKLIFYDDLSRKFYTSESQKLMNQRAAEVAESRSDFGVKETVRENGNEPFENAKSIAIEEEEVILFKPIMRHNSAPLYASITDDEMHLDDANDQTTPSDESLCRAASPFVAQNKAQIGNFRNKPFKLHEPLPKCWDKNTNAYFHPNGSGMITSACDSVNFLLALSLVIRIPSIIFAGPKSFIENLLDRLSFTSTVEMTCNELVSDSELFWSIFSTQDQGEELEFLTTQSSQNSRSSCFSPGNFPFVIMAFMPFSLMCPSLKCHVVASGSDEAAASTVFVPDHSASFSRGPLDFPHLDFERPLLLPRLADLPRSVLKALPDVSAAPLDFLRNSSLRIMPTTSSYFSLLEPEELLTAMTRLSQLSATRPSFAIFMLKSLFIKYTLFDAEGFSYILDNAAIKPDVVFSFDILNATDEDRVNRICRNCRLGMSGSTFHIPNTKDTASYPAGPPSLSAWVLSRESLNTKKEKGKKDFYKPGLSPIEEIASVSLPSLSISETGDSLIDSLPLPYSTPMPSAPLLPDDAIWFNANAKETNGILGASPLSSYTNLSPTHGQLSFGYQPVLGMSSSEWLYQYTNQNLDRASNQVWPVHFYSPGRLGNYFYGHDGYRFDLCDRWGNPLSPNRMVFLESSQLHSGSPLIYGAAVEERRERLFQNYQRPSPYGCGGAAATELRAEQPPPLLHYLKEKEMLLQQQSQLKSPTYMGQ
ncbi:nonsense-mediated mRNA decay factor SMG7-like [Actinidia eriantha]|uniref:nonsense-mediated mRNA decay factor SMG7-like n=1 Tax=Actinidia eriantha TaxID=165200 RepID=UPI0025865946|nr:nonsense-mediated mRNA decay factor SMG7-like [Actinidia eriantha]